MNTNNLPAKRQLPDYAALHHDPEKAFKNDQLQMLLNKPVSAKWVKKHPLVKVKNNEGKSVALEYLPVDTVKRLLTQIFQDWRNDITGVYQMFNSVVVTVRLHLQHPLTGEWSYKDGIGAVGVQTDAGEDASAMQRIKHDAVMKAAPSAESYALKNAAEKLGPLFGSELGKPDIISFGKMWSSDSEPAPVKKTEQPKAESSKKEEDDDLPM